MDKARLALDTFEEIANHLSADNDYAALSSLSLTSSALVEPCRKHIFQAIVLHDDGTPSAYEMFNQVLAQSPRVGTYVQRIRLLFHNFKESDSVHFHSILDHVTKPIVLRIAPFASQNGVIGPWSNLPIGFREGVNRILRYPTLSYLWFDRMRLIPVSILARANSVRDLRLTTSTLRPAGPSTPLPVPSARPPLLSFVIENSIAFSNSCGPTDNGDVTYTCVARAFPFDLTRLIDLEVDVNYNVANQVQGLIDRCKNTLETLCFHINGAGVVSLNDLPKLQLVQVVVTPPSFLVPPGTRGTHSTFFDIMKTLDTKCPLQHGIIIEAKFPAIYFQRIPADIWTRLDNLLVALGRKVSINTSAADENWMTLLPKSDKRGILAVVNVTIV
ncbi:hypothetical protein BDN72DRAFT_846740 [Pluteus cervinus]|uniref:Uncharacterized protein n=1 Tax=Pluteus cervinus TaxID=181527 RepID=A0ACD3AF36_9AGAR|nr:hypothetical protein BDN72DRAFT_846740 [Pluteus cervinus]